MAGKARVVRRRSGRVPETTCRGCPLTRSRSLWCYGLCEPRGGLGQCGRVAPHALHGRTSSAILRLKVARGELPVRVA